MCQVTFGISMSMDVEDVSSIGCMAVVNGRFAVQRTSPRCLALDTLGGDALRRHVLVKAAEKARQNAVQAHRSRLSLSDMVYFGPPNRRTLVIDLDILCKGVQVRGYNGQLAHRIWPRPHFRPFLETVQRLFRIAVWSKSDGSWADAALSALDPHHHLLPRRMFEVKCNALGCSGLGSAILDDGEAVRPDDVLIVSASRHAFGAMAQNVIEVESYAMSYGGNYDDVLLQLAAILVRHLAGGSAAAACAADGAAAMAAPLPSAPVAAVPDELRRLGLHTVRMGSCMPRNLCIDVRHYLPVDDANPLDLHGKQEDCRASPEVRSWRHLEFLDLVRLGCDGDAGGGLQDPASSQDGAAASETPEQALRHPLRRPCSQKERQERLRLVSADPLAPDAYVDAQEDASSSGACTGLCTSTVSLESSVDVASSLSPQSTNDGVTDDGATPANAARGGCVGSNTAAAATTASQGCPPDTVCCVCSVERPRQGQSRVREGSRAKGGQADSGGGDVGSVPATMAQFLRRVRCAVAASKGRDVRAKGGAGAVMAATPAALAAAVAAAAVAAAAAPAAVVGSAAPSPPTRAAEPVGLKRLIGFLPRSLKPAAAERR